MAEVYQTEVWFYWNYFSVLCAFPWNYTNFSKYLFSKGDSQESLTY